MGAQTFVETSVDSIPAMVDRLRATYWSQKARPIEFRQKALRKLYWAIEDHKQQLIDALQADLGKGFYAAMIEEITWVQNDCIFMADNLPKWAKDEKPSDIAFPNNLMSPRIRKDPLGVVLVIGAFNFPIQLSLGPMIGAIAAGNTVLLKPSEGSPQCAVVMEKIVAAAFDANTYTTAQGGIPQTKALLAQKWDKIFFTGSPRTGAIIAQEAAKTLTPIVLELGGRNPAFVTRKANVALAARRLLWSKTMNAGQVCISQNYTLVDAAVVDQFVAELKKNLQSFYPKGVEASADYGRISNKASFNRLKSMLDASKGKIVAGGQMDESKLFLAPTVVIVSSPDDSLLTEESFGPLIPILPVRDLDQAIEIANKVHSTPLSLMAFGDKAETDKILASTRSGGASVNDGFYHGVIPTMSFGGVGDSGHGSYRGKASFDAFVHRRPVTKTPGWMEALLDVRYPPFDGTSKFSQFARLGVKSPNFDRAGNVKLGWVTWFVTIGGLLAGKRGKFAISTALTAAFAVGLKYLIENKQLTLPLTLSK